MAISATIAATAPECDSPTSSVMLCNNSELHASSLRAQLIDLCQTVRLSESCAVDNASVPRGCCRMVNMLACASAFCANLRTAAKFPRINFLGFFPAHDQVASIIIMYWTSFI